MSCLVCGKKTSLEDYCDDHCAHSTVDDRIRRHNLRCSFCRPHKGENRCYKKHGKQKARYKDKGRRKGSKKSA